MARIPLVKPGQAGIREAAAIPNRIGGSDGNGSGRFNRRGRGWLLVRQLLQKRLFRVSAADVFNFVQKGSADE
ncbi:hypothetical protein CU048_15470 [Beijerinckiaceae bacterium]|nr:hypothetical protein CU048_15470 [Beijerinckiaceae bacterium]